MISSSLVSQIVIIKCWLFDFFKKFVLTSYTCKNLFINPFNSVDFYTHLFKWCNFVYYNYSFIYKICISGININIIGVFWKLESSIFPAKDILNTSLNIEFWYNCVCWIFVLLFFWYNIYFKDQIRISQVQRTVKTFYVNLCWRVN